MRGLSVLILCAAAAWGQQEFYLDLSGEWRLTSHDPGAVPAVTARVFVLPRQQLPPHGIHWLSREVEIPPWVDTGRLSIAAGPFAESYEVWVNGERIASTGAFDLGQTYVARPRVFPVPPGVVGPGSRMTIAFLIWRPVWVSAPARAIEKFDDEGPYALTTVPATVLRHLPDSMMWARERWATRSVIFSLIQTVLAPLAFLGWLGNRKNRELLFLAGFLFARSFNGVLGYASVAGDWPHQTAAYFALGLSASIIFLTNLALDIAGQRLLWLRYASGIPLLIHASAHVGIPLLDFAVFTATFIPLSGAIVVFVAGSVWRTRQQHSWRVRPLLLPAALILTAILAQPFASTPLASTPLASTPLAGVSVVCLAFVMTILLMTRLGESRQRLKDELESARVIQQILLAAPPLAPGIAVEAVYQPAQEVGGDFHWTRVDPDGALVAVVGDVSGKGLKAAMLVSVVIGILRNEKSSSPGAILRALNGGLAGHTGGGFVTCCCARFAAAGTVTIANAGHPSPYCDGRELAVEAGLPLGVVAGVAYEESIVRGERFTFVSDGVVEAENSRRELFGFDRTRAISAKSAQEIAEAAKAWGQNDDITVVTVRRTG